MRMAAVSLAGKMAQLAECDGPKGPRVLDGADEARRAWNWRCQSPFAIPQKSKQKGYATVA